MYFFIFILFRIDIPVIRKLFETVLLNRLDELNNDQSELQFGFTKGLSPTMAALILSEAVLDSAHTRDPLYIAALDTQKAFDVVSHPVLMKMLHFQGINSHLWQVIRSMTVGSAPGSSGKAKSASLFVFFRVYVKEGSSRHISTKPI